MCEEKKRLGSGDEEYSEGLSNKDMSEVMDDRGGANMTKIDKSKYGGLTKEKKETMRKLMGSASSKTINYNRIREDLKNETN